MTTYTEIELRNTEDKEINELKQEINRVNFQIRDLRLYPLSDEYDYNVKPPLLIPGVTVTERRIGSLTEVINDGKPGLKRF
jgi:hypothetical protein